MGRAIDASAELLRAEAPVFTRRNLFHALRRAHGAPTTEAGFDAALRRRLAHGPLPGLLPERRQPLPQGWDAGFPAAVLMVDRPAILDLFLASGAIDPQKLSVVCIDGTPSRAVARLVRGFRAGRRAPVLYVHDAATVVYPFAIEPLATLVESLQDGPPAYADLGLPPLGATARRFGDPRLPDDEPVLELEAIPPATLLRYCIRAADRLAPGEGAARDGERA
jgi:hypothetical protein